MSFATSRRPARLLSVLAVASLTLAGCAGNNQIEAVGGSIGQQLSLTGCPALGVPSETGDATLFDPPASRDASAIDVVATISDLAGRCDSTSDPAALRTAATFRVDARRSRTAGARDVVLPYYAVVVRSGDRVISKSVSNVALHFDDGKALATTTARADASVNRAEATLPEPIRDRIARKRKAKDEDASVDPMSDPAVRSALAKSSFELLVGFQLSDAQLAYNATR